jgi:hypothetical protein
VIVVVVEIPLYMWNFSDFGDLDDMLEIVTVGPA